MDCWRRILPFTVNMKTRNRLRKQPTQKQCSAINCRNYQNTCPELAFHRFPKDSDRCARWVQNLRNASLMGICSEWLHQSYRVCSAHFHPSQFKRPDDVHAGLNWNAVPTKVNAPNPPPPLDLESGRKPPKKRQELPPKKGEPAYEMMATDPDRPPSLNLGQADITHTDTAPSSRRSKRCRPFKREQLRKTTLQAAVPRARRAGGSGQRGARRGGKAAAAGKAAAGGNGDDSSNGDAADASAAKRISPNLKRKKAYKILLDEEAIPGETSEGGPGSEKRKLDIEGRYPQGSWEQATVEAIMNLRTFDAAATTSHIAQTIIANLKDENDFLRAQNIKLQWELKSMREKHSADLRATEEELLALRHRCRCTDEGSKTPPAVTTAPDAEAAEAMEIGLSGVSKPIFRNRAPTPGPAVPCGTVGDLDAANSPQHCSKTEDDSEILTVII